MDRRTDRQADLPVEIQFSVILLGLPDHVHEEKPSFLQFKKTHYGWTDGRMDRPTDPLIEMRGRI